MGRISKNYLRYTKNMITNYFMSLDNSEPLKKEELHGTVYWSQNSGSVESEVGEFLYGMVKVLKPRKILETGTYRGWSSAYMAQGLKENGVGSIDTIEYEQEFITISKNRWSKLGLLEYIHEHQQDARTFTPLWDYDLMFLDTEPSLRFDELVRFYPYLRPGGYVFIHDLPPAFCQGNINTDHPEIESWPFGKCPQQIKDWVSSGDLHTFYFPNPRGMVGFYKKKQEDFL